MTNGLPASNDFPNGGSLFEGVGRNAQTELA